MIDRGEKVYASVAPSFIAALPEGATFASLSSAMKRMGFAGIEETAIGATAVSEEYAALAEKGKMPNLITTCCPTVNLLVEKYFPDLLDQLAPVPSPAVAHARMLRREGVAAGGAEDPAALEMHHTISRVYEQGRGVHLLPEG